MYNLEKLFNNAYQIIFEADQSKMTAAMKANDIKSRNNAQTIGIEIEFYSDMDMYSMRRHIHEDLGIERGDGNLAWAVEGDSSLTATGNENAYNVALAAGETFPSDIVLQYRGADKFVSYVVDYISSIGVFDRLAKLKSKRESDATLLQAASADEVAKYDSDLLASILDDPRYPHTPLDVSGECMSYLIDKRIFTPEDLTEAAISDLREMCRHDGDFEDYMEIECYDSENEFDDVGSSPSNREYGIEIKFDGPRKLSEKNTILHEIETIMNDKEIDPVTVYGAGDTNAGETGLHIHFGLASHELNNMDILRLVINTHQNMDKIEKLGKRPPGHWQWSVESFVTDLDKFINGEIDNINIPNDKMFGTSFLHIAGKGTVEFRWAHASLAEDVNALSEYIDLLVELINKSFTGSNELAYAGAIFKEAGVATAMDVPEGYIATRRLVAVKDNKVVNHGSMLNHAGTTPRARDDLIKLLKSTRKKLKDVIEHARVISEELHDRISKSGSDIDFSDPMIVDQEIDRLRKLGVDSNNNERLSTIVYIRAVQAKLSTVTEERDNIQEYFNNLMERYRKGK